MPAVYPTSIKSWTIKQDRVDIVEAGDVDDLQDELGAVQTILGTNPHISATFGTFNTLGARMEAADAILNQIANYFTSGGQLTQDQVAGLGDILSSLTSGVNNAATVTALSSAIASVVSAANAEVTNRTTADTHLQDQINSLSGTTTSGSSDLQTQLNTEITNRQNAVTNEATTRAGADTAAANRLTALENRFKQAEAQYENTSARSYTSSSSYQSFYLPTSIYSTSDFGSTKNGHPLVEIAGPQTRFYTDFGPSADIYAMTVTCTWQGTGGTSNNGVRGVRIKTAGGSTLAEFIKNANQDPNDEALSVVFVGRVSASANYYLIPEVLQNSGGTLTMRGHTPTTPTFATISRIPG